MPLETRPFFINVHVSKNVAGRIRHFKSRLSENSKPVGNTEDNFDGLKANMQLFRERLYHKSVKANATMSNVICSFTVAGLKFKVFQQ